MLSKKKEQRSFSNGPLRDQWEKRAQSMADECKQEAQWKEKSALKVLFSKWTYHWSLVSNGDKMKDEMSDFSKLTSRAAEENNKPKIKFKIVPPPPKPKAEPPPPPPSLRKKASPKPRRPKRKVEVDVFQLCWRESWMSLKPPKYLYLKAKELKIRFLGFTNIELTNSRKYKAKVYGSEAELTFPHDKWSNSWKQVKSPAQLELGQEKQFQWEIVFERQLIWKAEIEKYSLPTWAGTWKIMNFAFRQQKEKWDRIWPRYQQNLSNNSDRLQQLEEQDEPLGWDNSWQLSGQELELKDTTDNETLTAPSSSGSISVMVRIIDVFLPSWSDSWLLSAACLEKDEEYQQNWCSSWGYRQQIRWRKASLKSHHQHSNMLTRRRKTMNLFLTSHLDDNITDDSEWEKAWRSLKVCVNLEDELQEEQEEEEEEEQKEVEQMMNYTEEDKDERVDKVENVEVDNEEEEEKDEEVDEEEEKDEEVDEEEEKDEEVDEEEEKDEEVDEEEDGDEGDEEEDEREEDVDKNEEDKEETDEEVHKNKDKGNNKLYEEDEEDEDEQVDEEEEEEEEDEVNSEEKDKEVLMLEEEEEEEEEDEVNSEGKDKEVLMLEEKEDKEEDEVNEEDEDNEVEEEEKKDLYEEEGSEEEDEDEDRNINSEEEEIDEEDEESDLEVKKEVSKKDEEEESKSEEELDVEDDQDEEEDEELDVEVKNEADEIDEEEENDDKEESDLEDDEDVSKMDKDDIVKQEQDEEEGVKGDDGHEKVDDKAMDNKAEKGKEVKKLQKRVRCKPSVPLHLQFHKLNAAFSSWKQSWMVAVAHREGEERKEEEEQEEEWGAWKESWRICRWRRPEVDEVTCFSTEHRCQRYMRLMHEEDGTPTSEWTLSWKMKSAVKEEDSEEEEEEEEEEDDNDEDNDEEEEEEEEEES